MEPCFSLPRQHMRRQFTCSALHQQHLARCDPKQQHIGGAGQPLRYAKHAALRRRPAASHAATTCRAPVPNRTWQEPKRSPQAPSGVGSDDGTSWNAPVLGGSRYSKITSFLSYFLVTGGVGFAAWSLHPWLVDSVSDAFKLDFKDSMVTPLQNSFFAEMSLLFSIFSGNTMVFLYNRQKDLVDQFYSEMSLLEEVMEEAVYALGDEAFGILAQVRKYIDQEIRSEINQLPPLEDGLALNIIRCEARRLRNTGAEVSALMDATLKLAQSQNMRQAASLRALPLVHWVLLYVLGITFVLTLVLLEPGGSFSSEGRQLLFTVLAGLMAFVLMVISDLADPSEGVYSSAAAMEERLEYTDRMLERHQRLPIIPEPGLGHANAETNAYLNRRPAGVAVTKEDIDGREVKGLASLTVRQPKLYPPQAPKLPKRAQLPDLYGSRPSSPGNILSEIRWLRWLRFEADASTQQDSAPRQPPRE